MSVYLPLSRRWRFVDMGTVVEEGNWDLGCWGLCWRFFLRPTTNTVDILNEYGHQYNPADVIPAPFNAGLPVGTSTASSGLGPMLVTLLGLFLLLYLVMKGK